MLQHDALNRAQRDAYMDALRSDHLIRLDVQLRDRDERPIDSLTAPINRVLSGAVDVDTTADVSRSLELQLLDPHGRLKFEANSPAQGALFADRFIAVRYEVAVAELEEWVRVPVFWGPLTNFRREGAEVTLEGMGKEVLMLAPQLATRGYTLAKRTRTDDAIKRVARRCGEQRFDLPDLDHRLERARSISRATEPWLVIAGGGEDREGKRVPGLLEKGSGNRHAYYTPRGRLTARRRPRRPRHTFRTGRDILTPPALMWDALEFVNTIIVLGVAPKGKPPAHGRAQLPTHHPLSPAKLARNGQPRFMTSIVDTELKTNKACQARAEDMLDNAATSGMEASFEALPVPHLKEDDMVRVRTADYAFSFRARQFTLPLAATDAMTVGANREVDYARRKRYRR